MALIRRPYDPLKRFLDVFLSLIAAVVLLPVMAVVAVLVAVNLGRPVLFTQRRPGLGGRVFVLRKFRSMRDVDLSRSLVTDEQRLTQFGRLLRSTSLDELPSLWNVLRGDMSLVGPRPLLVEYLPLYSKDQARRHEVRPGITGLAQISGRNALSWEDKFTRDVEYVDTRSLGLDTRIIFATVRSVFVREGISAQGEATTCKFGGSDA